MSKQIILIGGGASIREGLTLGLWDKLKDKFVLGTNYSFKYFLSTATCCVDWDFYDKQREELKNLPLVITRDRKKNAVYSSNTIAIPTISTYKRNIVPDGLYGGMLTGVFSLSLAIYLLGIGEIYLLGYDWTNTYKAGEAAQTHFYQGEISHRGIGKINYYRSHTSSHVYNVFKNETECKIYNVSLNSNISEFPKISYPEFFDRLNKETYDQNILRSNIRTKLSHFIR